MNREKKNDYGSLCTQMYELLHPKADGQVLDFYLSYAGQGQKILEPLCGSGRFLIPFLERGYDIIGVDLSQPMLEKLKEKAPDAKAIQADLIQYAPEEQFDYIFIPAGSLGLFTDLGIRKELLQKIRSWLAPGGKFVFSVDTIHAKSPEDAAYQIGTSVKTEEGFDLILKWKNHYDEQSQTQFSPSIYELYDGTTLLKREYMDFQFHLYREGEMEEALKQCGFHAIRTYTSYDKTAALGGGAEMLLYECSV